MATDQAPVNGGFAPHQQSYGSAEQHTNANNNSTASVSSNAPSSSGSGAADIPKDEVGWYFVEQYYTTLSRSPDRLYLFYNKRSQFVSGNEEEKVPVCIGQKAINDKIKELDFSDCKVRITNVDSQGSDQHIIIQVIGEISNKHAPHRKFAQTFVLATQTNGYFVLNDIFRYIADEEAELEAEESPEEEATEAVEEPAAPAVEATETLSSSTDPSVREADAAKVDKELEDATQHDTAESEQAAASPAAVNGTPPSETPEVEAAEDTQAAPVASEEKPSEEEAVAAVEEEVTQPEKPKAPESTPAPAAAKPSAPAAAPSKPAAPKSWASLAAAAHRVAIPQAPIATSSTTPKPAGAAQTPSAAATAAPTAPAAASAAAPAQRDASPANSGADSASGWQTAGADHTKRQGRQAPVGTATEEQSIRAYIKNVYESVDADTLKKELTKFGELSYFDVSRQKNCAFVDFTTRAGFQAAVAANPHKVGEDSIFVEERRVRTGNNFGFQRGGGVQRGRGDGRPAGQGRGGFKPEGGRGGFTPRGRGGASTPRGRGTSQAA